MACDGEEGEERADALLRSIDEAVQWHRWDRRCQCEHSVQQCMTHTPGHIKSAITCIEQSRNSDPNEGVVPMPALKMNIFMTNITKDGSITMAQTE